MKYIKGVLLFLGQSLQFIVWHMPISVAALIGFYFAINLLINPNENTISITNYSFAIVAALSSICFAYSRAIDDDKEIRETLQYCGERFLHSAIQFLVASLVKYFILQDKISSPIGKSQFIIFGIALLSFIPGLLFLNSLINGIAALRELNTILYKRKKPGQELIKLF
jgi:hypothetical protein